MKCSQSCVGANGGWVSIAYRCHKTRRSNAGGQLMSNAESPVEGEMAVNHRGLSRPAIPPPTRPRAPSVDV